MNDMKKNTVCAALLFVLTILFFAGVVGTGKTFIARDTYLFYNPRQFFAAESVRSGTLPLWNPWVACGVPFHANLQSALLYPLNAIYYVLPFQQGFKYFIVLHYFLGALFMFALMRQWGGRRSGALLAGIVFAFGGFLASIQDNVAFLAAGVWLPLIMLLFHRALSTGRPAYIIASGASIAVQIFAGDASFIVLSSFMATALYALYWSLVRARGTAKKACACFAFAWAAGLGMAAVQLLPFLEFAVNSHRFGGLAFAQATKWSYHPAELLQLLTPYPFGTTVPATRWFGQLWLDTSYIGVFSLILALLGLAADTGRLRWFLAVLLAVNLLLSFGSHTPLYKALHATLPPFQVLQFPVKFLYLVGFALAVLAGRGLDWLVGTGADTKAALPAGLLCGVGLAAAAPLLGDRAWGDELYAAFLRAYPGEEYFAPIAQQQYHGLLAGCSLALILCLLFAGLLVGLRKKMLAPAVFLVCVVGIAALDLKLARPEDPLMSQAAIERHSATASLLHRDRSLFRIYSLARFYMPGFAHLYTAPFDRTYRFLRETLRANLNMYEHLASAEEYSEMLNKPFYDLWLPVEAYFSENGGDTQLWAYCRMLLSLMNVKYVISPAARPDLGFRLLADRPVYVYENGQVLPRAFFPQQVELCGTAEEVLARMQEPGFDPRKTACVLAGQPGAAGARLPGGAVRGTEPSAVWTEHGTQRYRLRTDCREPGLLVVSDSFYPGWTVSVDGRTAPLLRVNHCMRGVVVGSGRHEVLFAFRPLSFTLGAWISALCFLACAVVLAAGLRQDRRRGGRAGAAC